MRLLSESVRLARGHGSTVTLDGDFGRDLEEIINKPPRTAQPARMGLILDSSVVIAAERGGDTVEQLIERVVKLGGDQDAALSAVGLTELIHGIY